MKGLLCFLFAFSVLFAANHASATGEAEEAIKSVFAVYKETWNQKDADGLISLFHEEAKIMEGYKNPQIKSKSEYRGLLPAKFKRVGSVKFKKIKINATDHEATVKVTAVYPKLSRGNTVYFTFKLL
jgi:hypothetical protein